jgi:hypothetical protein
MRAKRVRSPKTNIASRSQIRGAVRDPCHTFFVFKLGVYRLDQFQKPQSIQARLSRNRVSFHLLRGAASPDQVRLFESVMPQIQLANGVYRTTSRGRFKAFDQAVNGLLGKYFDSARALDIHDWASSDCVASSEWATALWACFPNAHVTASDLTLYLLEAARPNGEMFIWETGGEPLQYIRPPFVIRLNPAEHTLLVVNRILAWHGRRQFANLLPSWNIPEQWLNTENAAPLDRAPFVLRKIPLIHPEAEALRLRSDRFTIILHSAFEPLERPSDVIRTMNIFNLKYFSTAELGEGIEAVRRSLVPGGIWIVGRTFQEDPPAHDASVFMKDGDGFRLLERYGKGSEVEPLVPAVVRQ